MTTTHPPAPPRTAPPPPATTPSAARSTRIAVWLVPSVLVVCVGFERRWMSDDAYIYVRTVRQVLAGNGPVFNAGERVESSTGTLWQWLLVAAGAVGADPASAAVYGGLALTGAGFALAGLGALRLHGGRVAVPLGALLLLGLPPVWDFATSGLETGLLTCWIAGAWLALVARPRSLATSVLLGLGPLVRPDLGLVSVVFLGAQWLLVRPSWRGVLAGAGAAGVLPAAYEVFRAGYYGHLVPLPAVTKEASGSLWGRGVGYLADLVLTYALWVPAVVVVVVSVVLVRGGGPGRVAGPPLVPALAPVVAGVLCWVYVVKVGGDFMHGRMLLPGLLLMLLPVFVVPVSRVGVCAALAVGAWAVVSAGWLRVPYEGGVGPAGIADERGVYVRQNADPYPVRHTFAGSPYHRRYLREVREAARSGAPTLLFGGSGPRATANSPSVTASYVVLGLNGAAVPLNGAALDPIGLAHPLAAHSERIEGGRVGHDKWLPAAWLAADRGVPADPPPGTDPARTDAARRALRCGALAELRAATRDPLTPGRFVRNVAGAWERTAFRFPNDPLVAERKVCGR
ncbi:hypothetical protein [Streptomyces sp. YU58]|uniref:hypothetical protein n=1 Tax=Streptomyces sp. SX92 TaxID=3158972 RepID=UPI0027BA27D1|nr:hypothetical protein [Streptomyces coralus]WLW54874.1 hypothetical protein QU709_27590 [Streptomyces coralus]